MMTVEQLRVVMPRLHTLQAVRYLPFLLEAMAEAGITTPLRASAFLAQVAHESNQLTQWKEVWGPTDQQKRYEPPSSLARTLGNTEKGDAYRYRGRSPLMLTGRANYRKAGTALELPLEARPWLVTQPDIGFRAAAWFWTDKGLNPIADDIDITYWLDLAKKPEKEPNFRKLTKRINGAEDGPFTHLSARCAYFGKALRVLLPKGG
jgi:putative chitinase